ncbi:MAG TPA: universal stress protein [Candidatus Cybelea sp.]|nr:universal stress protein [Candidatus Cybelea sp.]
MALKDILVHLDASARGTQRLALACDLAGRHSAHLIAVYVIEMPSPALFLGDPSGYVDPRFIEEIMSKARDAGMRDALRVEKEFRERLRRDGIEGEWRLVEGIPAEIVALHARYADLAIVGQHDSSAGSAAGDWQIPAATLLSSGRPMLVVPYAGEFPVIGQSVLVAWKSTREAARAVNDALPLLQQAGTVTVLAINPERGIGGDGEVPAADIAVHLARHGVKVTARHTLARDISEGEVLLNMAEDMGADLIVAGGYGHSRMRELAFGGVTRTLLTTMTVPVLLSH